jgi:hypothetical protein
MLSNIKTLGNIATLYQTEQTRRKQMIQLALESGYNMLTIQAFICATKYKLTDALPFDMMWHSFRQNIPIYMNDTIIKAFGYSGTLFNQKKSILKLVEKYNIPTIQLSNDDYAEFSHYPEPMPNICDQLNLTELYPPLTKTQLKSKPTHVLMMPRDLKKLLLVVNTDNGNLVREYMISLDELFELYMSYQDEYKSKQLSIKDEKIDTLIADMKQQTQLMTEQTQLLTELRTEQEEQTEMIDELTTKIDRATDERAPRATSHGSFILLQLNDPTSHYHFYVIRAERNRALKARTKILDKHVRATTAVEFGYQPNAMNLFTLIKEDLGKKGRKLVEENGNYITLTRNYSIATFLDDVRHIKASKKTVG